MKIKITHPWDLSPADAIQLQRELCSGIIEADDLGPVRYVAGVDVGFEQSNTITCAAVAILTFPELTLIEHAISRQATRMPYIPGLLSFREIPAVLDAMQQLKQLPDLLLCDGQGRAHPRRFGIASHLGLITDIPSIGVGKTRLTGTHEEVPNERGAWQTLLDKGETIGAVLRTRINTKPIYVSVGHRISLETAIKYVMACTPRYRLPETTRIADKLASSKL